MNKWTARVLGILLLLFFMFLFTDLQRKLILMQKEPPAPAQKK